MLYMGAISRLLERNPHIDDFSWKYGKNPYGKKGTPEQRYTNHVNSAHRGEFRPDCPACLELQRKLNGITTTCS